MMKTMFGRFGSSAEAGTARKAINGTRDFIMTFIGCWLCRWRVKDPSRALDGAI